jgi:hypothetical protein
VIVTGLGRYFRCTEGKILPRVTDNNVDWVVPRVGRASEPNFALLEER